VSEIFSWEVSQARYFDPTFGGVLLPGQRNVVLSQMELTPVHFSGWAPHLLAGGVGVPRFSPVPGYSLEWRTDYDPARGRIVDSSLTGGFPGGYYFLSVGQTQVHSDTLLTPQADQLRASVGNRQPDAARLECGRNSDL
jgi:LPS-assembly protein